MSSYLSEHASVGIQLFFEPEAQAHIFARQGN
jgi:hypothetical protein